MDSEFVDAAPEGFDGLFEQIQAENDNIDEIEGEYEDPYFPAGAGIMSLGKWTEWWEQRPF
jgi:hypothetical protein